MEMIVRSGCESETTVLFRTVLRDEPVMVINTWVVDVEKMIGWKMRHLRQY